MSDIIRPIEPFELTQGFGGNAEAYARFGLKGHNGWDLRTKLSDTPQGFRNIFASWYSKFYSQGNEGNDGYGLYFEVIVQLYNTYKLTYAHCKSIEHFENKNEGGVMAISDNTGNSTGSHLHLTVKRGQLKNGKFVNNNYNNGFFGAINPQQFFDELRKYKKEKGATSVPEGCLIPNTPEWRIKYEQIVSSATKWAESLKFLEIHDDPNTTPSERIKSIVGGYKSRETDLSNKLNDRQVELDKTTQEVENRIEQVSRLEKALLDKEKYYKSQINALNKQIKNGSSALPLAQTRIGVLEDELDEANKAKGRALIDAQEYKSKFETCQKDKLPLDPTPEIIFSLAIQYIGKLLRRKGGDQYEQ
jgi:hypothetical protein